MSQVRISNHACQRMAQRGLQITDIDLILQLGSEVDDGFMVLKKDLDGAERSITAVLNRIRKLRSKRLVISDGCLVTAYHADSAKERKIMKARDRKR